jgi:hypothetical protein
MNTYYLRTINYPQLLDFGTRLGVIAMTYAERDEEGAPIGEGTPYATDCGYLDYIGEITRDEEVIVNGDGIPYIHANLITPHDLRALAIASTDPEIQAALADIAGWFVVDSNGNAVAPQHPTRMFG